MGSLRCPDYGRTRESSGLPVFEDHLLVDPAEQPEEPSCLEVPRDFYWILGGPAPLAGMVFPPFTGVLWDELSDFGFRSVVCLSESDPAYDPFPLLLTWSGELEDLHHGWSPLDPERELLKIRAATDVVVGELEADRGVIVHCRGGIGRTGTVLAASLVQLGLDQEASITHIESINLARGHDWPESDWHLEAIDRCF